MKKAAILLLCLSACISVSAQIKTNTLLPLSKGNYWKYQMNEGGIHTIRIDGDTNWNNKRAFRFIMDEDPLKPEYFYENEQGIFMYANTFWQLFSPHTVSTGDTLRERELIYIVQGVNETLITPDSVEVNTLIKAICLNQEHESYAVYLKQGIGWIAVLDSGGEYMFWLTECRLNKKVYKAEEL